ncbi:MAG: hypothetical protein HYY37_02460 [Candidatus Aenigmarchaeota archaeon]|nr:hypothetical protein [Candidatus Aenigmarchaeota archaeon]
MRGGGILCLVVVSLLFASVGSAETTTGPANGTAGPGGDAGPYGGGTYLLSNGDACTAASTNCPSTNDTCMDVSCSSGYCVHNVCRSSDPTCGDGYCDSGESCTSDNSGCSSGRACTNGCVESSGGGGGSSGSASTVSATTTTTVPATTTTTTLPPVQNLGTPVEVTEQATVTEVVMVVPPESLGLTEVNAGTVKVEKVAEASVVTSVVTERVEQTVDQALATAVTETAKEALQEIKQNMQSSSSQPVLVSKSVEVFLVTAKDTGKSTTVTKVTLSFSSPVDATNIKVVEVIPKSVAASANDLVFLGLKPVILQADPIVQWSFDEVKKGESKDMSYTVKKNLTKIESTTIAAATLAPATTTTIRPTTTTVPSQATGQDNSVIFLLLAGIVIAVSVYLFIRYYH